MSAYFDSAKGRWRFEFNKVIRGNRVRVTKLLPKGWNRTKAEDFAKKETDRLYAVATGAERERARIEDAVQLYYVHRCPELKNGDGVKKELARIYGYYAGRFIDELPEVAAEYIEAERERLSPASIRNKLSYLRAACKYAYKHHRVGDGNIHMPVPAVSNERQVYATRAEMIQIARQCRNRHARALIRLGFYSGMRLGEMMTLGRKGKVMDGAFLLSNTKNGSERLVPMHPKLRVVCRFLPVPYQKRWMQRLTREAMDAAGLPHVVLHDLRHSAASAMINNEVDLYTVGKILGHKDQRSTQRYSHLSVDTLTAAIRKIR